MNEYAVELTRAAETAIYEQAKFIALVRQEPLNATRWLQRMFEAIQTLETFPMRCALAEENEGVDYDVRQLPVGSAVLLFTIDEESKTVWLIAFRGQGQLASCDDLPSDRPTRPLE